MLVVDVIARAWLAAHTPLHIPASGAFTLPDAFTACTQKSECTLVSLGCCDTTAVNHAHEKKLRAALESSGRPHCPVKSACGPSKDGTWDGAIGACVDGHCKRP